MHILHFYFVGQSWRAVPGNKGYPVIQDNKKTKQKQTNRKQKTWSDDQDVGHCSDDNIFTDLIKSF